MTLGGGESMSVYGLDRETVAGMPAMRTYEDAGGDGESDELRLTYWKPMGFEAEAGAPVFAISKALAATSVPPKPENLISPGTLSSRKAIPYFDISYSPLLGRSRDDEDSDIYTGEITLEDMQRITLLGIMGDGGHSSVGRYDPRHPHASGGITHTDDKLLRSGIMRGKGGMRDRYIPIHLSGSTKVTNYFPDAIRASQYLFFVSYLDVISSRGGRMSKKRPYLVSFSSDRSRPGVDEVMGHVTEFMTERGVSPGSRYMRLSEIKRTYRLHRIGYTTQAITCRNIGQVRQRRSELGMGTLTHSPVSYLSDPLEISIDIENI
jgi:hypothetical protein